MRFQSIACKVGMNNKTIKNKQRYIRKTAQAMHSVGFDADNIAKELNISVEHVKNITTRVKIDLEKIIYTNKGFCEYKHRKHRRKAFCEINGVKYCFSCATRIVAQSGQKTKPLIKQRNINKNNRRRNKKKKVKTKQNWITKIKKSWEDTPEQKVIRQSQEYQQWRIAVLERDKYTCQHCNKTGGKLHCHHIKSFKFYPEIRFDIENGIVLCKECHENLHLSRYKKPKVLKIA